MHMIADD